MNDEIKEILDNFEKYEARYKLHNETQFIITHREIQILLDYITNLQQAFERSYTEEQVDFAVNEVKEQLKIEKQYSNQLCNEIDKLRIKNYELQQENERLKGENNNKAMNDYAHAIDESWYRELYNDYKYRCEKAIEYINDILYPIGSCVNGSDLPYESIESLLNILQNGGDNE